MERSLETNAEIHMPYNHGETHVLGEENFLNGNGFYRTESSESVSTDINPATAQVSRVALSNGSLQIGVMTGDAALALQELPSNTFNVVVTSPPYFWARDYEVKGQIGHEETVEVYVSNLMKVFDEVQRVLHPEGVFYLNIGDTYYSGNGQPHGQDPRSPSRNFMRKTMRAVDRSGWDIPKKSLIGIPWKVALTMQQKGWTLRSDIIWNRCNAFSEPTARDRPHRQHEHIFLFSKSRFYSYDRSQLCKEEDVWNIPIERAKRIEHNAPFPTELVRRCILTGSPRGGFVLDPFVGSGTTLDVALNLGRHAVGVDLNLNYTSEVVDLLHKRNCVASDWNILTETLLQEPELWSIWSGNKNNFRKPGTPRS
jgi:DNA modification methylase